MRIVATVVLEHIAGDGRHFDWMLEDPAAEGPRPGLVTFRVGEPPASWGGRRLTLLERIGDHRRAYLARQGPLSGNRGYVRRIDRGRAVVLRWVEGRALLGLRLRELRATVRLRRIEGGRWALEQLL